MDKYVFLVFLLAPGFIACSTSFMLHDFPDKKNELGIIMRYFAYSFFILPIALCFCMLFGIVSWGTTLNSDIMPLTFGNMVIIFFIVAVISVATGTIYPMFLRQKFLQIANNINHKRGVNEVFVSPRLFEKLFDDGQDHFILVERDGKLITMGLYGGAGAPDNDKTELYVFAYPDYQKEFKKAQKDRKNDHPLKHCKRVYMALEDNLVIREYEFPKEWSMR